jgi:DNA polymerase-1
VERKVLRAEEEAREFLKDFNWRVFALDTEVTDLNWKKQQVIGISLCDGRKTCYFTKPKDFLIFLTDDRVINTIIMHNATFDMKVMTKMCMHFKNVEIFDTMVAHHLLDEEAEHGLKAIAKTLLGKDDVLDYDEAIKHGTDSEVFCNYAMNDAEWTYELAMLLKPKLEEQGLTKLFREIEMPFLKVLSRMEMNGVLVDQERVNKTTIELQRKLQQLETTMLQSLGMKVLVQHDLLGNIDIVSPINFNSSQQIATIITKQLGLPLETVTEKGAVKVDKNTLRVLSGKHPFIDLLIDYKAVQKLLTAFFEPLPGFIDSDGRVRPHYKDTGTVTGRLSCSNPNLQQLPKESKKLGVNVRSCFIASPGKKLIAIDYSGQELRIAADIAQDPNMIRIMNNGGDLHLINSNIVFNLGIPEEKLFETHPEYEAIKKQYKKERDKTFSFGVLYGMGEHKLSRDFNVSIEDAAGLLNKYFEIYPSLKSTIDKYHAKAQQDLYVTSYTGRRRRFKKNQWGKVDSSSLRQSFNFAIQSYGADLIRLASIRLQEYVDIRPFLGARLLLTVHDELVIEVADEWADFMVEQSKKIFEGCASLVVPLMAEASAGLSYGDVK